MKNILSEVQMPVMQLNSSSSIVFTINKEINKSVFYFHPVAKNRMSHMPIITKVCISCDSIYIYTESNSTKDNSKYFKNVHNFIMQHLFHSNGNCFRQLFLLASIFKDDLSQFRRRKQIVL